MVVPDISNISFPLKYLEYFDSCPSEVIIQVAPLYHLHNSVDFKTIIVIILSE
jgi:hypothetical protein